MKEFKKLIFLSFWLILSCKPPENSDVRFCYGQDGFIPGELACHLLQGLDEKEEVFLCFPQQLFDGNCTWKPALQWAEVCHQPMPHSQEQFITKFCHK